MKKRLLFAAVAMMCAVASYAFEAGEYVYTATQRLKVTGENIIAGENILDGWTNAEGDAYDPATWSIVDNTIVSLGATEGAAIARAFILDPGTYVVSYQIKAPDGGKGTTSTGTTIGANYADIFINNSGSLVKPTTVEEGDTLISVAGAVDFGDQWKTVNYYVVIEEGQQLVMHFEKMATDISLGAFAIQTAEQVYDIRGILKTIEMAKRLMDDPNFNIEDAQAEYEQLYQTIEGIEGMMALNMLDGEDTGLTMEENLANDLESFLSMSSENIAKNSFFQYSEDLTTFPKKNRGNIANGEQVGGFIFRGDNWWHSDKADYFQKFILPGANNNNGPGSVAMVNNKMPKGKYFISAELRNGYTRKDWGLDFTLEAGVKAFVGNDSIDLGTIQGEEYQRLYAVIDYTGSAPFEAGFYWDGPNVVNPSGAVNVRGFMIRSFENVEDYVAHLAAWETFKAQWDAAVNARNAVVDKLTNPYYPWERDSLRNALTQWDPFYNEVVEKGWVTEDGQDAGVATTEELEDWAKYQGGEIPEDGKATYQVVRGYQNASNYSAAANKAIIDLAAEIENAEKTLVDDKYSAPNDEQFIGEINNAKNALESVVTKTSDATREADEVTLSNVLQVLQEAIEAFKARHIAAPIVDIDFSNTFEEVIVDEVVSGYVIKGNAGEMTFGTDVDLDNTVGSWNWALGFDGQLEDVLHVGGSSYGRVAIPVELTKNDILDVNFDVWFGELGNGYFDILLLNAAGERVAGFSVDVYNAKTGYNDFNNDANEGLNIIANKTSKHDKNGGALSICVDENRTSMDLMLDFKAGTVQGKMVNGNKVSVEGGVLPMTIPASGDCIVTTFAVGSEAGDGTPTYAKANSGANGRRCWFDNLKMFKYVSSAESGINSVVETAPAAKGVYTLSGVKLNNAENLQKGLYIINGKKVAIK